MTARLVFDLDGTLIDSAPDIRAMANAALEKVGAAPITLQETRSFVGEGIAAFVRKARAARDLPDSLQEVLMEEIVVRYDTAVHLTKPYPGVRAALEVLTRRHRLGICTNKPLQPCLAVLRHLALDPFFESVWGGDNPLGRKPDPASLLAVFDELGGGPRLYVGDSETDAETAARARVPFLLFTEGYRKSPVAQIPQAAAFDSFAALPGLVEGMLSRSGA